MTPRRFRLQRLSALAMAPLVITHLAVMIYAIQGGLTSAEILARTQSTPLWALFYETFVLTAALHGAIGIRTIAAEWLGWDSPPLMWATGLILAATGTYAVWAVT